MENSGIYKITNKVNNKIYIGSAVNFKRRRSEHFSDLKHNNHSNQHLQNAYNKYGEKNFEFSILIKYPVEELIIAEQVFINVFNPEYNICKTANSRLGVKASKETIEKLRQAGLGNINWLGKSHTKESREKISKSNKGKYYRIDYTHSEATKQKISKSSLGRKMSDQAKEKLRKANLGKKLSKETIEKIVQFKYVPVVQLTKNGEYINEFPSIKSAGEALNIPGCNISGCCKHTHKMAHKYKFMYKEQYEKIKT